MQTFLFKEKAIIYRNYVALVHRGEPIKGEPLLVSQIVLQYVPIKLKLQYF